MENFTLHNKLVKYLEDLPMKKKELVSFLSDLLCIEKESVYRRLNGKIIFTLPEFEVVTKRLDITVDRLMDKNPPYTLFSYNIMAPRSIHSLDVLIKEINLNRNMLGENHANSVEVGQVVDSLPYELFSYFDNLTKFMYFKWAYCFMENKFYSTYSEWEVPGDLILIQDEFLDFCLNFKNILYIWDKTIIPNLVSEIEFLYRIHILHKEDVALIINDLHDFLDNMENMARGAGNFKIKKPEEVEIYISNNYIGGTTAYYKSYENHYTYFKTPYMQTLMYEDLENYKKIYNWVNSMKKVSTLISGSGEIERRIFFEEQHKIIDSKFA